MAKKVEKEELEEKVDGALLDLLEQRTGFPKLIAECVIAASRATEKAVVVYFFYFFIYLFIYFFGLFFFCLHENIFNEHYKRYIYDSAVCTEIN